MAWPQAKATARKPNLASREAHCSFHRPRFGGVFHVRHACFSHARKPLEFAQQARGKAVGLPGLSCGFLLRKACETTAKDTGFAVEKTWVFLVFHSSIMGTRPSFSVCFMEVCRGFSMGFIGLCCGFCVGSCLSIRGCPLWGRAVRLRPEPCGFPSLTQQPRHRAQRSRQHHGQGNARLAPGTPGDARAAHRLMPGLACAPAGRWIRPCGALTGLCPAWRG